MLKRHLSRIHSEQKGITGLETAIILIAFVVVASVFAYTVLGAGLFAAERGREAVHAGLEVARATVVVRGGVIASGNVTTGLDGVITRGNVTQLVFTVAQSVGGEPINFVAPVPTPAGANTTDTGPGSVNVVVISLIDERQHVTDLAWSWEPIGAHDDDDLLEAGEKFQITIPNLIHLGYQLEAGRTFTIQIKPPVGAVLTLERTIPVVIDPVMDLR